MSASSGGAPAAHPPANSRQARQETGRLRREQLSRKNLGQLPAKRAFDPIELLLTSTEGRLPDLLPVKYERMRVSPFAFFRGSVPLMAADLGSQPHSGIMVQLCGDAHVQNMGCFEGPDGRLIFDINDFDETIRGPWEWDVKRMTASLVLAGTESGHSRSGNAKAVESFSRTYASFIEELAEQPILTAARHQIRRADRIQAVSAAIKQAQRASPLDLLKKYTKPIPKEGPRFKTVEQVLWPVTGADGQSVLESLPVYIESLAPDKRHLFSFFHPTDVAFKIVGTGSVALRDYVVLMEGNGAKDPLFLQFKQEVHSAYADHLRTSSYAHQGLRVADGQRRIQPLSDPLLGWTRIDERDYLVRQLNDHKGSIDIQNLRGPGLCNLAEIAGELLARGHARSGDALTIKGYIGNPERVVSSLVKYALDYANQTESDFEQFQKAIRDGRVRLPRDAAQQVHSVAS